MLRATLLLMGTLVVVSDAQSFLGGLFGGGGGGDEEPPQFPSSAESGPPPAPEAAPEEEAPEEKKAPEKKKKKEGPTTYGPKDKGDDPTYGFGADPYGDARRTAYLDKTGKSPTGCEICKSPDVTGTEATPLYQEDFKGFCDKCRKGKLEDEKIDAPGSETKGGCCREYLLEMDCPKKEKEQCEKAGGKVTLKRDIVPKEAAVKKSEKLVKKKEDEKVPPDHPTFSFGADAYGDKKRTEELDKTGTSPTGCEICKSPDVQGERASELYNTDFKGFCDKCNKGKAEQKKIDAPGSATKRGCCREYLLEMDCPKKEKEKCLKDGGTIDLLSMSPQQQDHDGQEQPDSSQFRAPQGFAVLALAASFGAVAGYTFSTKMNRRQQLHDPSLSDPFYSQDPAADNA